MGLRPGRSQRQACDPRRSQGHRGNQQQEALRTALGRSLARSHGCFSCHGEEGRARQPNPGSLKGYIPSWEGDDFTELVHDGTELRAWIEDGNIARLQGNPAARIFMDRQRIKMPAYKGVLSEEEINRVIAYIRWLRDAE